MTIDPDYLTDVEETLRDIWTQAWVATKSYATSAMFARQFAAKDGCSEGLREQLRLHAYACDCLAHVAAMPLSFHPSYYGPNPTPPSERT
jgi:hypothetical protein